MSTRPGCNQYGHAPGCGHPSAGSRAEPNLDLLGAQETVTDAVEKALRDAYEAGQRDAYARAADLIHEFDGPSSVLVGHVMRHPDGKFSVEVPDECGYEMADKVLGAASDSLRAYATGGFAEEAKAYAAAPSGACGTCHGSGFGYPIDADRGLYGGGPCTDCGGTGDASKATCQTCQGSGEVGVDGEECSSCTGTGHVTRPAQPAQPASDPWAGAGDGRGSYLLPGSADTLTVGVNDTPMPTGHSLCGRCDGGGYEPAFDGQPCYACGGAGSHAAPDDDAVTCTYCSGAANACEVCGERGTMAPTPSGQDTVHVPGRGSFYRSRIADGRYPTGDVYAMRFEANRPLTDDETRHLTQLIGYRWRASIGGEPVSDPTRDSDRSFVVSADSTKGRGSVYDFEDGLDGLFAEGSPVRTTDRAGAGTKGTRLVEGLGDPNLKITVYYDSEST